MHGLLGLILRHLRIIPKLIRGSAGPLDRRLVHLLLTIVWHCYIQEKDTRLLLSQRALGHVVFVVFRIW